MKLLQLKSRTEGQFNRSIDAIVQWILEHPKGSLQQRRCDTRNEGSHRTP